MESRKITIVATRTQKKSVIMSSATTLAELKADLDANGIDYYDMAFYEGVAKVTLKDDASVLPHDVPYKGTTTNELVIMLTTESKKIKSGMDRTSLYEFIKAHGLVSEVLRIYGKSFTQLSTESLQEFVDEFNSDAEEAGVEVEIETKCSLKDTKARKAINKLVSKMEDQGYFNEYEVKEILDILNEDNERPSLESSYSDDELEDMIADADI